jgi:hypothetical protein
VEISIGQDPGGSPIIFVKGNNPEKVAKAYLATKRIVSPSMRDIMKKREGKTK